MLMALSMYRTHYRSLGRRLSSSVAHRNYSSLATHLLAGVAGGSLVIAAGYTWYHFSNVKKAVDAATNLKAYLVQTKRSMNEKHPSEALAYLRNAAKSYAAVVPGSGFLLDKAFDSIDEIIETHRTEATAIILKAYTEIRDIQSNTAGDALEISVKVMDVLRFRLGQLTALGGKAGADLLAPLLDKYPEASAAVQAGFDELAQLAKRSGQKGQQLASETKAQAKEMLSVSKGKEGLDRAYGLVKGRIQQLKREQSEERQGDEVHHEETKS